MDSENHLTFVFIFMLMVVALIIGEANNQALNQREKMKHGTRLSQAQSKSMQIAQPSEVR